MWEGRGEGPGISSWKGKWEKPRGGGFGVLCKPCSAPHLFFEGVTETADGLLVSGLLLTFGPSGQVDPVGSWLGHTPGTCCWSPGVVGGLELCAWVTPGSLFPEPAFS